MYAPIVSRFHTYAVEVGAVSRAYMAAVMDLPAWREWKDAALKEPWVVPEDEPDWPTVLRVGSD
jgi:glutathione S-transferase